jgi:hypothetical protein
MIHQSYYSVYSLTLKKVVIPAQAGIQAGTEPN